MARNADEIIAAMPAKSRERIEEMANWLIANEMTLQQLRKDRAAVRSIPDASQDHRSKEQ